MTTLSPALEQKDATPPKRTPPPRLGFLGVGWIGRHRMEAIIASEIAEVAAIADPSEAMRAGAKLIAPNAIYGTSLEDLLNAGIDGIVIATPSALHAEQAIQALERGIAVFCQKPLGRTANETKAVIDAARAANRLLGVDLSYRFMAGVQAINDLIQSGQLGEIYAAELVFHNAYGPDKPWFYDPKLSGGGCVIDLGIHLVDLAFWLLRASRFTDITSCLFASGNPIRGISNTVEDHATALITLEGGAVIQLACSWKLPAGRDAVIEGRFYGTKGGAGFYNLDGSFYDFVAEHFTGTTRHVLSSPPDSWGGRAALDWVQRLAASPAYDADIEHLLGVSQALDAIYGRPTL